MLYISNHSLLHIRGFELAHSNKLRIYIFCIQGFITAFLRCRGRVQTFTSCTSVPDICQCLVVESPMETHVKIYEIKILVKHINGQRTCSLRIKATFSCEVIHASMCRKLGCNQACNRVLRAGIKCYFCQ